MSLTNFVLLATPEPRGWTGRWDDGCMLMVSVSGRRTKGPVHLREAAKGGLAIHGVLPSSS